MFLFKPILSGLTHSLSSKHFDDILFMGPKVCNVLTEIEFRYTDVDYDAHNGKKPHWKTSKYHILTRRLQMRMV